MLTFETKEVQINTNEWNRAAHKLLLFLNGCFLLLFIHKVWQEMFSLTKLSEKKTFDIIVVWIRSTNILCTAFG